MAGASAGLAPGTIGRIGRSAYVHFFLLARGWPGATLAILVTLVTSAILVILAILTTLIILPLKATIFLLTIIIIIAKISYITAIFI